MGFSLFISYLALYPAFPRALDSFPVHTTSLVPPTPTTQDQEWITRSPDPVHQRVCSTRRTTTAEDDTKHIFRGVFPSKRARIPAIINGEKVLNVTIDSASDVPCISAEFLESNPTLQQHTVHPIPPGAINSRSADGSVFKARGFVRYTLT